MAHPLLFDGTWLQQNKYESAEAFYQKVLAGTNSEATQSPNNPVSQKKGSNKSEGSKLKSEIAQARQNIQKALTELACLYVVQGGAKDTSGAGGAVDPQVLQRIKNLEQENKNLKQTSQDLTALVKKLEQRISALEKSNSGSNPAPTEAPKPVAAANDDDDDMDLFGDSDDSDDEETAAKMEALRAYNMKKAKKPAVIAKSSLLLDVKPWDDETDMKELEAHVRSIEADGLVWGQGKLVEVGYGIKKLQINAVIEDDKISTDFLEEEITKFEDHVQSMDIAAFNKI